MSSPFPTPSSTSRSLVDQRFFDYTEGNSIGVSDPDPTEFAELSLKLA